MSLNKIKNLLGPLRMCCCDVVLYFYSIAVPSFVILSSLTFPLSSIIVLHWNIAAVVLCSSAKDMQSYGATLLLCCSAAVLWCFSAFDLQCYSATVLLGSSAIVPKCYGSAVL